MWRWHHSTFCGKTHPKPDKTRFCHDGTTLAATSFQNNIQIVCVLMHGVHYRLEQKYLTEMVVPISALPGRERSAGSLNIFRTRLKFTEHSFVVSVPAAWNSLPLELKQTNNTLKFKKLLKSHLFLLAYSKLFWLLCHLRTSGGLIKVLMMMILFLIMMMTTMMHSWIKIFKMLSKLNTTSPGTDSLLHWFLRIHRKAAPSISSPFTQLINLSLTTSIVPGHGKPAPSH